MKLSLFSVSYAGYWGQAQLDVATFVAKTAALGYDAVMLAGKRPHLSPLDADDAMVGRLHELLTENQIACSVVAAYTDFSVTAPSGGLR